MDKINATLENSLYSHSKSQTQVADQESQLDDNDESRFDRLLEVNRETFKTLERSGDSSVHVRMRKGTDVSATHHESMLEERKRAMTAK